MFQTFFLPGLLRVIVIRGSTSDNSCNVFYKRTFGYFWRSNSNISTSTANVAHFPHIVMLKFSILLISSHFFRRISFIDGLNDLCSYLYFGKVNNIAILGLHPIQKVKFLSKNSILTKPQHFHEFFTRIFFFLTIFS